MLNTHIIIEHIHHTRCSYCAWCIWTITSKLYCYSKGKSYCDGTRYLHQRYFDGRCTVPAIIPVDVELMTAFGHTISPNNVPKTITVLGKMWVNKDQFYRHTSSSLWGFTCSQRRQLIVIGEWGRDGKALQGYMYTTVTDVKRNYFCSFFQVPLKSDYISQWGQKTLHVHI